MGNPKQQRMDVFKYWGSWSRSMLTCFELTIGNFIPVTRLLMDHVSEWYSLIILVYKCTMGFAVVKVINGVFMHETFNVANSDNQLMILQRQRTIQMHKQKMTLLFDATDVSGDGLLSLEEFRDILHDPWVKTWLAAMELSTDDGDTLFEIIAEDDGRIDPAELVQGVAKLKGAARSMDLLALKRGIKHMFQKDFQLLQKVSEELQKDFELHRTEVAALLARSDQVPASSGDAIAR